MQCKSEPQTCTHWKLRPFVARPASAVVVCGGMAEGCVCVCDGTCVRERDWLLLFSLNFPTAANTCFWPLGGRAWERENP